MIVSPVLTYGRLSLQDSEGRSTGLHMSDLYSDLYQRLEPQRFNKSTPLDPVRLAAGLAFEKALESALVRELGPQLGGERPGEFIVYVNGTSLAFTPDLIITDASGWMLGEIKCTWMSCSECPLSRAMIDAAGLSPASVNWDGLDPDVAFPAKFDKYFCPVPNTPVLSADLRYRAVGDYRCNDTVLGFDEYLSLGQSRRRLRRSRVEATTFVRKPLVRLYLADGTSIDCSDEHYWLASRQSDGPYEWTATSNLLSTDGRGTRRESLWLQRVVSPSLSSKLSAYEQGWLAGILDGEGSLGISNSPHGLQLTVSQNPGLVLSQIRDLLARDGFSFYESKGKHSGCVSLHISRTAEIIRALGTYRPVRLLDRFARLPLPSLPTESVQVVGREPRGPGWVSSVQTECRTFLAQGLASHNTQMKSYCYHLSMPRARLIVYFVNGDWRPPVPCLLSWDFTFNEQELAEEWAKLYHHGTRVMGVF